MMSALDADEWRQAMEAELHGLRGKGSFKDEEPPSNIRKADQDALRLQTETRGS